MRIKRLVANRVGGAVVRIQTDHIGLGSIGKVVVVDPCVVIAFGKIFGDAFRGIAGFVGEPQQIALAAVEG